MRHLFNALAAFTVAAGLGGAGPLAVPPNPRWGAVAAELRAARPEARLAAQIRGLLRAGTFRPDPARPGMD